MHLPGRHGLHLRPRRLTSTTSRPTTRTHTIISHSSHLSTNNPLTSANAFGTGIAGTRTPTRRSRERNPLISGIRDPLTRGSVPGIGTTLRDPAPLELSPRPLRKTTPPTARAPHDRARERLDARVAALATVGHEGLSHHVRPRPRTKGSDPTPRAR